MPYPLPLTRTEAYLAYKAGVIQQSDLKPSLAVPRNGIDAWLAYWTGLTADYPKREDGTPHILQEEEAYIAYLCGVINEYPEKCLRRVGAYLRYLISARWGRPDHPLNREELYLSLIKTQFIPSGDPSSDITIDGTAKAPFVDVKMYGDTYQQTYTGKNLVNLTTMTASGVSSKNNGDGTVTITGTASESSSVAIMNAAREIEAGTYTLTISKALPFTINLSYRGVSFRIAAGATSATSTATGNFASGNLWMVITEGTTYNETFGVQLTQGSTPDTDFEPYVGGQPSPSPDYPQPIQTVTGRQVVNVTGKNLYRSESLTTTWDGASVITDGSEITFTGNSGGNSSMSYSRQKIPISIPSGTTLTVSAKTVSGKAWGSGALRCGVRLYYSDGTNSNLYIPDYYPGNFGTTKSTTITTNKDVIGVAPAGLSYSAKGIIDPVTFVCQLEKGSTATAYEPYSSNDYEINLGKNLFDKDNMDTRNGYLYRTTFSYRTTNADRAFIVPCEPNTTYTISRSVKTSSFRAAYIDLKPSEIPADASSETSLTCAGYIANNSGTSITITTSATAKSLLVHYGNTNTDGVTLIGQSVATIMVEKSASATAYAPYFTPIELCKLGTYQDYIWKDNGDWKVHKATNDVTLTGEEYWQYETVGTSATFFQLQNSRWDEVFGANTHPIGEEAGVVQPTAAFACDGLKSIDASDINMKINQGCGKKGIWFRIALLNTWNVSTAKQFRTWLSTHNMKIKYALATATDTTITDSTLIDQLEALVKGGSEEGTTYIKVNATDPNLPGLLYVEAPKYD